MTTRNPLLEGCTVLPPMEPAEPVRSAERPETKRKPNRQNTGNRFAILNTFVDTAAGELTRSEILVWLVLYRDTRDGLAGTSQADIARRAGTTDRTVRRVIGRLERRGLLTTVYRGGLNRGTSKYRISPELTGRPLRT